MGQTSVSSFFTGLVGRFFRSRYFSQQIYLGQKGPVWIETQRPHQVYEEIPEFKMVIDRRARMKSNAVIKHINIETGEDVGTDELYRLLENPNPMQGQNEWIAEGEVQFLVFGNRFQYKNVPLPGLKALPETIFNISPQFMAPVLTGKLFRQRVMKEIIEYYKYYDYHQFDRFETDEILFQKNLTLSSPLIGQSSVLNLKFPLTNTKLAYEYRNVILGEHGLLGILSNNSGKAGMGSTPFTRRQRKRIEEEHRKQYGIQQGKSKLLITEANVKYTPTSYPTKDMMLFEEVDANKQTLIDHFGLNVHMFAGGDATFENVKNGIKLALQDTIIPSMDEDMMKTGKWLGPKVIPPGTKLVASYDHLPVMREDRAQSATSFKTISEGVAALVTAGLLDAAEGKRVIQTELGNLNTGGA